MPDRVTLDADCYGCHRNEDVHFAIKGVDCDRCHVATGWRDVKDRPLSRALVGAAWPVPAGGVLAGWFAARAR